MNISLNEKERFLLSVSLIQQYGFIKEHIDRNLFTKCEALKNRIGRHQSNQENCFKIGFCGVFSSGKTSLINLLLNYQYKLPTGIMPLTKVVTRICYGKKLYFGYYSMGKWFSLTDEQALNVIRGELPLLPDCEEIIVKMPAEILKRNIEFIDTPGFDDEMGGKLEEISRKAIAQADYIVMCGNALQLAKIFERNLLDELALSVGNFCLVVTRMDCLNTDDDIINIRRQAWDMMNRNENFFGNAAHLADCSGKHFFCTCSDTDYVLDEFDLYLKKIAFDPFKVRAIQKTTDETALLYCLNEINKTAALLYQCAEQSFQEIEKKNNKSIAQKEKENKIKRLLEAELAEKLKTSGEVIISENLSILEHCFSQLNPRGFVANASAIAEEAIDATINELTKLISQEKINPRITAYSALRILNGQELSFSIPPVEVYQVKKRGLFGQAKRTLLDLVDYETLIVDDGYDLEYNDFRGNAKKTLKNGVFNNIRYRWNNYIDQELLNKTNTQIIGDFQKERDDLLTQRNIWKKLYEITLSPVT